MNKNAKSSLIGGSTLAFILLSAPVATPRAAEPAGTQAQSASSDLMGGNSAGKTAESIRLRLVDVSLIDFFRLMSEITGLNILVDPDVQGTLTIQADDLPWDELFDSVLESRGLVRTLRGRLVRISTRRTLKAEFESRRSFERESLLDKPLQTVARRLSHASAGELLGTLEIQLSERGRVMADERTNALILSDLPENVGQLLELIESLDVPEEQVEIEARIIEATTRFVRELGVNLFRLSAGGEGDRFQAEVGVSPSEQDPLGTIGFSAGRIIDTVRLDSIIAAAERKGEARILSRPRVSSQNNAEAVITQGARIPIPVTQNFTTTVRFETAALQLTVTPQVTMDRHILLRIRVENNIPDFTRTVHGIPTILTSESRTVVLVPNGGTTVVGGILVEMDRESVDKVPALGDVPLLGLLFRRNTSSRETREILFFITPRIKGDEDETEP